MTDEKRALLGDHEAAKRLTAAGVLLPCPGCGGENAKHRAVMGKALCMGLSLKDWRR